MTFPGSGFVPVSVETSKASRYKYVFTRIGLFLTQNELALFKIPVFKTFALPRQFQDMKGCFSSAGFFSVVQYFFQVVVRLTYVAICTHFISTRIIGASV